MRNRDKLNRLDLGDFDNASSLIYGIGNVGRQDDGLGWAFIDWIEAESMCPKAEVMRNYQLHLEDADLISRYERVLFVDASKESSLGAFSVEAERPNMDFSFTSHAISIPSIMATCQQCFQRLPEVYVLAIKGYEWELKMGLTTKAQFNLNLALSYFKGEYQASIAK